MDQRPTIEADEAVLALLDLARGGQGIVITRGGRPVAELRSLDADMPAHAADIEWLRRHRVGRLDPEAPDAVALVRALRDEGSH